MNPEPLVVGIDAGGTKTAVWIASCEAGEDDRPLGRGEAGPANPQAVGFAVALQNLDQALERAFADASRAPATVEAACVGLAGVDRDADRQRLVDWAAARRLARRVRIVHDALPVLAAGSQLGWGIALIAGTGSFAWGCRPDGRSARAGGWGYLLGDEGSGYWVAVEGLRRATRCADGRGTATRLLDLLLSELEIGDPAELVSVLYRPEMDRARIAGLAELVFRAAASGDDCARLIVSRAAGELALLVHCLASKLDFAEHPFPLAVAGGLWLHDALLRDDFLGALREQKLQARPFTIVNNPVAGAIRVARGDARGNRILPGL